jgi:RNA polymerase sigma factor (sigma-70 family)
LRLLDQRDARQRQHAGACFGAGRQAQQLPAHDERAGRVTAQFTGMSLQQRFTQSLSQALQIERSQCLIKTMAQRTIRQQWARRQLTNAGQTQLAVRRRCSDQNQPDKEKDLLHENNNAETVEENPPAQRFLHYDMSAQDIRQRIAELLPRLRRFARTVAWQREDADDLVQIALERALKSADQWQEGTRLDSWLFRIMKNAWIDELRARGRRDEVMAPEEAGEHVGVSETAGHITRLSVQAAMAKLPEDQRMAVSLVLVEGLSYKEAAESLDVPIGTLTSRLARGRETLQRLLGDGELE